MLLLDVLLLDVLELDDVSGALLASLELEALGGRKRVAPLDVESLLVV